MDKISKERRSWNMSRIKGKDTKPEITVRKYLFSKGYRYRLHTQLPGKPDMVLPKYKHVIFVNGCFWHGHDKCKIAYMPKTNTEFWKNKIEETKKRDRRNSELLVKNGWYISTIWECELKMDHISTLSSIENSIRENYRATSR